MIVNLRNYNKKLHECKQKMCCNKTVSFLYSLGSNEIRIYTIFDTGQDPDKIKKDIK